MVLDPGDQLLWCPPYSVTAHGDQYIIGRLYDDLYTHIYDDNGNQICEGYLVSSSD
jgi:hypothetical protein